VRQVLLAGAGAFLVLLACTNRRASANDSIGKVLPGVPKVTRTTALPLDVDTSAFVAHGCKASGSGLDCAAVLGGACSIAVIPLPGLTALDPRIPIAQCIEQDYGPGHVSSDLVHLGGLMNATRNFVLVEGDNFAFIRSRADFARRFAPVTSPAEALAFAIALSTGAPDFAPTTNPALHYYVSSIDGTRVTTTASGYDVSLFDYHAFGCSHPTWAISVAVKRDGAVTVGQVGPLYSDPKMDGMCVD
jgi:hypothetical protein